MRKSKASIFLASVITGLTLSACRPAFPTPVSNSTPTSISGPTVTMPLPTLSPTPWPLQVELGEWSRQVSREKLLELVPGKSTLQDLYALVGHPGARADYPSGVVLRYASELGKLPHVVLVDGMTGKVLLVSIYDFHKNFFYLSGFVSKYGEPVLAHAGYGRDRLFFPGAGVALITDSKDRNDILYAQLFPKETSLNDCRAHQGYWQETFAFTP